MLRDNPGGAPSEHQQHLLELLDLWRQGRYRTTEFLGDREIEMTLRYSHLAPSHKAKAMDKLGDVLEMITNTTEGDAARQAEGKQAPAKVANLAQRRNVFLARSARGLSVIGPKESVNQTVSPSSEWGGGNRTNLLNS